MHRPLPKIAPMQNNLLMKKTEFTELVITAFKREAIKRLVFSRPTSGDATKISCRLCAHRGRRLLAMESSLPGNTVSQKNVTEEQLGNEISVLLENYRQVNLITTLGDAEWKTNKKGGEVILGGDSLKRKLSGEVPAFERAIEALDKKKNYLLTGDEEFLKRLGVSSSDGRVHDKKQGKFRQINRFLEHIEDVYKNLPGEGEIRIFDLCSGKSYLSFAVYYYLTEVKKRSVDMLCVDLKRDVILWCEGLAGELCYSGMRFRFEDISKMEACETPHMVISLHACDIATDIVLDTAIRLGAGVILSTPCCHNYLNSRISSPKLSFITEFPHLKGKLCEAVTDALRLLRLRSAGYSVSAPELTDPENTPKNTLIRAIKNDRVKPSEKEAFAKEYESCLEFILGNGRNNYLKDF